MVGGAGTAVDGLAPAMSLRPDGMLVDINLPDGDGLAPAGCSACPGGPGCSSDPDAIGPDELAAEGIIGFLPKEERPDAPIDLLLVP